ncbi:MAG: YbjN domain-containing protein [Phenylobacterium sp.]|uniref:YbjN domain-containing protein n=1 Tax=Phenylobacterium sp. TaxID=1871053 RepID=UPI0027352199|nr:YbjN domain-containing protein [Phenylobacterium sp.]MDP3748375.1 YbjN domain-containing protein [Phenylobacterium sp.]
MRLALFAILAFLAAGPAATAPAKPAAAKPAAPKAVAKPGFDARDPAAVAALLAGAGVKTETARGGEGQVAMKVVTPGGGFGMQFANCDAKGKACAGVAFSTGFDRQTPTLAHMNLFNRTQFACRGFTGEDGKPNVMYSTLLTSRMTAEDMKQHLGVWQGCLGAFAQFTRDPAGFLAANS